VIDVLRTDEFDAWLRGLRDPVARARVLVRVKRLSFGNPGDAKAVGAGISEMRVPYGRGYRVYYSRVGERVVVLLVGGDKSTQDRDIERAKTLAAGL
jgi:putative addiction module killer protein